MSQMEGIRHSKLQGRLSITTKSTEEGCGGEEVPQISAIKNTGERGLAK